jgi:hypothetical protein
MTNQDSPLLVDLLARVEGAERADRELDAAICAALRHIGPLGQEHMWTRQWAGPIEARGARVVLLGTDNAEKAWTQAPALTWSMDAALAFVEAVLPGAMWQVGFDPDDGSICARLVTVPPPCSHSKANHEHPALALIAATLKALIARGAADV